MGVLYRSERPRILVVSLDPGSTVYQNTGKPSPAGKPLKVREVAASDDELRHRQYHWFRTHDGVAAVVTGATGHVISPNEASLWFAHTSVVRCCANLKHRRMAPETLYWNCQRYLEDEIGVLAPDVIWSQGDGAWRAMSWIAPNLEDAGMEAGGIASARCAWGRTAWVHTLHPSTGKLRSAKAWTAVKATLLDAGEQWKARSGATPVA
jgi:hypothetical protein